jgi:hypothetical protein
VYASYKSIAMREQNRGVKACLIKKAVEDHDDPTKPSWPRP